MAFATATGVKELFPFPSVKFQLNFVVFGDPTTAVAVFLPLGLIIYN